MIDVESLIFDEISRAVEEAFPTVFMTGEYVRVPPSFPCVSLIEMDNATYRNTQTNQSQENHAAILYELNVYSNRQTGKKAECRAIVGFVDRLLQDRNFTRMMLEPIPNQDDATIYRMIGRYRAVASADNQLYRR